MIEALGYLWLRPGFALGALAALGLGVLLVRRAGHLGAWERAVEPHLMAAMRRMGRVSAGRSVLNLWPAGLALVLAIALMGPAEERRDQPAFRNLDAVLLVMDLSRSVTEGGRFADMLTTARLIAAEAGARQTGLIVYAGDAYLAAALTTDGRALGGTISLIEPETVPDTGSRPARALALAGETLRAARILAGDVVLLSDGGGIGPETAAAARALAGAGATLSTLHIPGDGSEGAAALASLATGAHGTITDPAPVTRHIAANPAVRLAEAGFPLLTLQDLGRWLLLLALIPALMLLPRREAP